MDLGPNIVTVTKCNSSVTVPTSQTRIGNSVQCVPFSSPGKVSGLIYIYIYIHLLTNLTRLYCIGVVYITYPDTLMLCFSTPSGKSRKNLGCLIYLFHQ